MVRASLRLLLVDADESGQYGMYYAVGSTTVRWPRGVVKAKPEGTRLPRWLGLGKEAGQGVAESCGRCPHRVGWSVASVRLQQQRLDRIPKGACHGPLAEHIRSPLMASTAADRGARCRSIGAIDRLGRRPQKKLPHPKKRVGA